MRSVCARSIPVLLLLLAIGSCDDGTTSFDPPDPRFAAQCGDPPCGKGPGGGEPEASYALSFDGTQGTETPDTDLLDLTDTFTIEGWIKPTSPAGHAFQDIVSKWGGSGSASYSVAFLDDGRFGLTTHTPGAVPDNTKLFTTQPLAAGQWVHFAMVFDHGAARIYLDGNLVASRTGMNTPDVTTSRVTLGRQKSPANYIGDQYYGVMDEIRFWNVVRSQRKIQKAMNTRLRGKEKGLVAYWRMDEGAGDETSDATGNGHTMQLGNDDGSDSPTWVAGKS